MKTNSAPVSGRFDFASTVNESDIFVLGGENCFPVSGSTKVFKDVWKSSDLGGILLILPCVILFLTLSGCYSSVSWKLLTPYGAEWTARRGTSLSMFNGDLVLAGGLSYNTDDYPMYLDDVWFSTDGGNLFLSVLRRARMC